MRALILSDIHANLEALEAVLADADQQGGGTGCNRGASVSLQRRAGGDDSKEAGPGVHCVR